MPAKNRIYRINPNLMARNGSKECVNRWHTVLQCRYGRLKWLRDSGLIGVNRILVNIVSFLHIAPHGMRDVHEMLVRVSLSLVQGGESGVFSPMHLLIFKKPEQD